MKIYSRKTNLKTRFYLPLFAADRAAAFARHHQSGPAHFNGVRGHNHAAVRGHFFFFFQYLNHLKRLLCLLCSLSRPRGNSCSTSPAWACPSPPKTWTPSHRSSRTFFFVFLCLYLSHIIQLTSQQQGAEPRNGAGAEALVVARRPKEASREKTRPPLF